MYDIVTEIGANLTPLENALNAGIGLIAEFGSEAKALVNKIAGEIGNSFESLFREGKIATGLGSTIDQFREMKFAADLSGIGVEGLNRIFINTERSIGKVLDGSKKIGAEFNALGLNAAELARHGPAAALTEMAKAIDAINNPAQRASAASTIFSAKGQQVGQLLEMLHLLAKSAGDVDSTFNRMRSNIGDLGLAKIEILVETWKTLQLGAQNVYDLLAVKFAVPLTNLLLQVLDLSAAGKTVSDMVDTIFLAFENGLASLARAGVTIFDFFKMQFDIFILVANSLIDSLKSGVNHFIGIYNALAAITHTPQIQINADQMFKAVISAQAAAAGLPYDILKALTSEKRRDDAADWVHNLFHGEAERLAKERAKDIADRRNVVGPIEMHGQPLGFAKTLEGVVGAPSAIGAAFNAATKEVQMVADTTAHQLLNNIDQKIGQPPRVF